MKGLGGAQGHAFGVLEFRCTTGESIEMRCQSNCWIGWCIWACNEVVLEDGEVIDEVVVVDGGHWSLLEVDLESMVVQWGSIGVTWGTIVGQLGNPSGQGRQRQGKGKVHSLGGAFPLRF